MRFLPIILVLFLTSPFLAGQGDGISTKFRLIAWESGTPSELAYLSGGEPVKVAGINNTLRSPFLEYKGPGTIQFYDPSALPSGTDGQEAPVPLASVGIPPGTKYPLIFLMPNPGGEPAYRHVVFDDNPSKFPFGTYLFQNLSKHKVAAEMSGERFVVEPNRSQYLVSSEKNALHLRLAVSEETEKGWKLVYDSFFPNWKERRTLVFVYETVKNGRSRIEVRTLIENEAVWKAAFEQEPND